VALPARVAEAIEDHLARPGTTDRLFTSPTGGPLRPSMFRQRVWGPAVRRSGLAPLRVHDLRHTAVALAVQAGAHPKAIQEMLGHGSITVTLDRYGHLFPSLSEDVADRVDEVARAAELVARSWHESDTPARQIDRRRGRT
jgi:integrase